jgi:acyl-phosphate glycerol 3-phosphate acyltransferase
MDFAVACLLAYLAGSIPFGYLLARYRGIDIRTVGSGNIGATNVTRNLGHKLGALVFVLDSAKGALPTALALWLTHDVAVAAAAGLSATIGHMFPVWLRFRGGKGVATGTGVVAVLMPATAIVALLVWLATLAATRFVAAASILAGATVFGVQLVTAATPLQGEQRTLTLFSLSAFVLIVVRHADNIMRLLTGREHQVSESSAMRSLAKIIHILAMGLWFGSNVFFTFVVALVVFKTWEGLGEDPPGWLPIYGKETATRIAGATIAPIFPFFYAMQLLCALLGLITAVGFSLSEPGRKVHRVRFYVILLAALTVMAGWPLSIQVGQLREQRYDRNPSVAQPAREQFGRLHTASLFLNFGTIGLVTAATALVAFLPGRVSEKKSG